MVSVVSSEFDNHYPVVVLKKKYSAVEVLNDGLSTHILSLEARYKDTDANASRDASIATEGGYQTATANNLFSERDGSIAAFLNSILQPSIDEYLHKLLGEQRNAIRPRPFGWANILRQGDWQRPHMHASTHNLISGVYYGSGTARTAATWLHRLCQSTTCVLASRLHTLSAYTARGRHAADVPPPYHMHYVHPVSNTEPRIVIAFDVVAA